MAEKRTTAKKAAKKSTAAKKATSTTSTAKKTAAKKAAAQRSSSAKATRKAPASTSRSAAGATGAKSAAARSAAAKVSAAKTTPAKSAPAKAPASRARDSFAAGADRATGERSKRTGTPLIGATDPLPVTPAASLGHGRPSRNALRAAARKTPRRLRAVSSAGPEAARPAAAAGQGAASEAPTTPTGAPVDPKQPRAGRGTDAIHRRHEAEHSGPTPVRAGESNTVLDPKISDLVETIITVMRSVGSAAGVSGDALERDIAEALAYLRKRVTGDVSIDEFGFDQDFTRSIYLPMLRPLYRRWFRVEVKGIENIPTTGGALVVGNHSGTVPVDGLMTMLAVHDEHPAHRHLRMLGADLVFRTPFVGTFARRSGTTLAANEDANRLLSGGELVGVWPEGFKGVGKPFSERYKLQRFGRGGFVSAALRNQVPIIPCSIVGAEEIYPIIGNIPSLARLLGVPYVPITPFWPFLGPLGLIPLPSKWIIQFGEPIHTDHLGPEAAEDPAIVFDLTDQVRETIQQSLYALLLERRSVFS